jgi:hypothetical protein
MTTLRIGTGDGPIVCTLSDSELATRREVNSDILVEKYQEVRELADGYALRFAGNDVSAQDLLGFIERERACCPFFIFELHFEPSEGGVWLCLRGPDGVKDLLREMIQLD